MNKRNLTREYLDTAKKEKKLRFKSDLTDKMKRSFFSFLAVSKYSRVRFRLIMSILLLFFPFLFSS